MSKDINQHLSLGLRSILSKLVSRGDTILDLGPLSTLTAPLFLQLQCRYYVEDMNEFILDSKSENLNDSLSNYLLEKPAETRFDTILCWDLFNFLSLDMISHLMSLLKPYLKPGTILHTIRYIGGSAPSLPKKFKYLDQYNYEVKDSAFDSRSNNNIVPQAHTTIMLLRALPEFSLYDTAMNQEGMMNDVAEYLLEYDSIIKDKKVKKRLSSEDVVSYFSQNTESKNLDLAGIAKLFDHSHKNTIRSVLDIGPKNGRQFTYLNDQCEELYIEDIYSSIAWQNKIVSESANSISKQLLSFSSNVEFDRVLLWDILNYCNAHQIKKIGELLSEHLSEGALLHLLIYKSSTIPAKPLLFELKKNHQVSLIGDLKYEKPRSLRSIAELMRFLPQFKLNFHHMGNTTNQHGYQEFILEFRGDN